MSTSCSHEPLAIVGIGCRFPGHAHTPQAFWDLLIREVDAVGEVPAERWDMQQFYHPDPSHPGTMYVRAGAFLDQVDHFDAPFFRVPPAEAKQMDPQQRLLLEVAWEALEDAGIPPSQLAGSQAGVFIGICTQDYYTLQHQAPHNINAYSNGGGVQAIAANRLSFFLNLHGPSFSVDTACSSSLVAIHLACQSIWNGECPLALVGGVNILLDPLASVGFSKAQMLSPTGRCQAFDARADGYVRGEGAGIVVLKPLSQARLAHDPIYAIIRGSGINQDGHTPSLHFPGRAAQEALLKQVYTDAKIPPSAISYIEAHGTGTPAGDPVECQALGTALGQKRANNQPLHIGSVKTNIGHLEGASGMAGLIKASLALKHRLLPANLHFQSPHPDIPFTALGLQVQQSAEPIPQSSTPPIIGVNSFGFGGTNAHVILEAVEPPMQIPQSIDKIPLLFPLSAHSPTALQELARSYLTFLQSKQAPSLRDLCFTASKRREHHQYRLAIIVKSHAELLAGLQAFLANQQQTNLFVSSTSQTKKEKLAFIFSGNGPQWWAMGRELIEHNTHFRTLIERCDQQLRTLTDWSLLEELLADEANSRMDRTDIAQPALFAIQIALVELWKEWGIEPQAVMGHSAGEVAAAYAAGILSFEDAIETVFYRSKLQERTAGQGKMLALSVSPQQAIKLIAPYSGQVSLAAINSPESVTLSGDPSALAAISAPLEKEGIFCRFLRFDYPFHSPALDPLQKELVAALDKVTPQAEERLFISTVRGTPFAGKDCNADYWWRNLRQPVQFAAGMQQLIEQDYTTFLEIGPHPALATYVVECLGNRPGSFVASLRRKENDNLCLLAALGKLYTLGFLPDWENITLLGNVVSLPTYSWQRERYWLDAQNQPDRVRHLHNPSLHPLLGTRLEMAQPIWESSLEQSRLAYLQEHLVGGVPLFPAAGHLEISLAAATNYFANEAVSLKYLRIHKPLPLNASQNTDLQTIFSPEASTLRICARNEQQGDWELYATCTIEPLQNPSPSLVTTLIELRLRCRRELSATAFYQDCAQRGLVYGPTFRLVEHIALGEQEVLGTIRIPETQSGYCLHPGLLDSCLQVFMANESCRHLQQTYLPIGLEQLRFHRAIPTQGLLYCHVRLAKQGSNYLLVDFTFYDRSGHLLVTIEHLRVQVAHGIGKTLDLAECPLYEERWQATTSRQEPLPDLSTLLERFQAPELPIQAYQKMLPFIEQLCQGYFLHALAQLGWQWRPGEHFTVPLLIKRLNILPRYTSLIVAWCQLLAKQGLLRQEIRGWVILSSPILEDIHELQRHCFTQYPAYHASSILIARCGRQLAEILTGNVDPLTLIFTDTEGGFLEQLYESDLATWCTNRLFQETLKQLIECLPAKRQLRILEIGAGTGGATSFLLPLLPPEDTSYIFTDITEAFLQRAQHRYRAYPFVDYQILDIENDPQAQGFAEHNFDLIIANNVLHATNDLRQVLQHTRSLLASEGFLFLAEVTQPLSPFMLLIFGLLDGYWRFQDYSLRPSLPLLDEKAWQTLLTDVGFPKIALLSAQDGERLPDQTAFLAQAPFIKQPTTQTIEPMRVNWLVFADPDGIVNQLQEQLGGDDFIQIQRGSSFQILGGLRFQVRPDSVTDMQSVLTILRKKQVKWDQILYLWSLTSKRATISAHYLEQTVRDDCQGLLTLIQALDGENRRLFVVSAGTTTWGSDQPVALEHAPLAGFTRVLFQEHQELRGMHIHLSLPQASESGITYASEEIRTLANELLFPRQESELRICGNSCFVNRIALTPPEASRRSDRLINDPEIAFRLEQPIPGQLDQLTLRTCARKQPGQGEVEIEVVTAGLHFKDVALATGLLPTEAGENGKNEFAIGMECAGRIVTLGKGVDTFQIGDEVVVIGDNCFSSFVTTSLACVMRKPASLSIMEGTTIFGTFLTAYYALKHLAHLSRGERVLIHGATGGVGLAAIQIVQQAGGIIFATAGSEEKRDYLRSIGIEHVYHSRSLSFAEEILQQTNGEGVDIVLNSLSGESAQKSLSLLRPYGRFLEIGKRDFFEGCAMSLRPFQRSLSYFAIDISSLLHTNPSLVAQLRDELTEHFEQGRYRPLPYRRFQLWQVQEAFHYMLRSRQIGKVIIEIQDQYAPVVSHQTSQTVTIHADATYLITGGLAGFGLATAEWLVEQGARYLALISRQGMPVAEELIKIEQMRAKGTHIVIAAVDVTQETAIAALLQQLRRDMPPLQGIIHAAMVLSDGAVQQMSQTSLMEAIAPKMLGAWHLHNLTEKMPLDFFILYSSISALLGSVGQANYVAGNQFLHALTSYRRAQGLPALTVGWGAIANTGFVSRHRETQEHLERVGLEFITPEQALASLQSLLQKDTHEQFVARISWSTYNRYNTNTLTAGRWNHLREDDLLEEPNKASKETHGISLFHMPTAELHTYVFTRFQEALVHVLGASAAHIGAEQLMTELGLDSLVALELRNQLKHNLDLDIPLMQLLRSQSVNDLVTSITAQLLEREETRRENQQEPSMFIAQAAG